MSDGPSSPTRPRGARAASAVIALVLLLQVVGGFRLLCLPRAVGEGAWRPCCAPKLWPFLDYNMYDRAWYPGRDFPWYVLVGLDAHGGETVIDHEDMGVSFERWRRWGVTAFVRGDAAALQPYVDGLADPRAYQALRLEDHRRVLGEDGRLHVEPPRRLRRLELRDGQVQP